MPNIYDQVRGNKRATAVVITVFILFFVLAGIGFDYFEGTGLHMYYGETVLPVPVFTVIAFLFSALYALSGYLYGDRLVLLSTHARELDPNDLKQNQWLHVVEEMSIAAGIPRPKTYIIDDPDPNAFATGRSPGNSSIVVTKGLLDSLNRDELQAVASHEMSHIKNLDIRLMLLITVLVGSVALISDWAGRGRGSLKTERSSDDKDGGSSGAAAIIFAVWLILVVLAPIISQLLAMCVSRRREYLADASGAELTRNPLALASALEKIDSHAAPTRSISEGTAHLCICDPKGRRMNSRECRAADLFATHPPVGRRIEALRQMAYLAA